jgi:hypothetical protein
MVFKMFSLTMNDRDLVDIYSQRREEYVALKERVNTMREQLQECLRDGKMDQFRSMQMRADVLCDSFHRVQDSMLFLEEKMCDILPKYRPEP